VSDAGEPAPGEDLEQIPEGYVIPDPSAWRPGSGGRKYDWPKIRSRYVEGFLDGERQIWPSLPEVAAHFGASPSMVRDKSAEEGWRERRSQYQAQVERERQALKATKLAKEADELDTSAVNVAKLGIGLVHARMLEIASSADTNRKRGERTGISSRELEELARAADLMHRIGLRGLGDPDVQRLEISGAIDISHELRRDDPDRLVAVLSVLHAAGLDLGVEGPDEEGARARYPAAIEAGG
jgi:hypothetical protein